MKQLIAIMIKILVIIFLPFEWIRCIFISLTSMRTIKEVVLTNYKDMWELLVLKIKDIQ